MNTLFLSRLFPSLLLFLLFIFYFLMILWWLFVLHVMVLQTFFTFTFHILVGASSSSPFSPILHYSYAFIWHSFFFNHFHYWYASYNGYNFSSITNLTDNYPFCQLHFTIVMEIGYPWSGDVACALGLITTSAPGIDYPAGPGLTHTIYSCILLYVSTRGWLNCALLFCCAHSNTRPNYIWFLIDIL